MGVCVMLSISLGWNDHYGNPVISFYGDVFGSGFGCHTTLSHMAIDSWTIQYAYVEVSAPLPPPPAPDFVSV